ncbi:hypothetical protein PsorP6_014936 [Peronosclerospora sorghi]|uniref:Uncharacterized protein n=1 Tax=Peronosclerospora sorghi TaxID=230839 RepID=A0ACC0VTI6_9STRA|nr:hypothetical protein PsorP6_014936 [Peronosclerospora sorghi]
MERASVREASCALCLGTQQGACRVLAKDIKQTEAAYANVRDAYKKAKAKLFEVARRAMHLKHVPESKAPWEDFVDAFGPLPDDLEAVRGQIKNNRVVLACLRGDRTIRELYERVRAEIERKKRAWPSAHRGRTGKKNETKRTEFKRLGRFGQREKMKEKLKETH